VEKPSYTYNVSVKDKVKWLEASIKDPNTKSPQRSPRPPRKWIRQNGSSATSSTRSSVNVSMESIPAIMDVEQTELSSRGQTPSPSPKLQRPQKPPRLAINNPPRKISQEHDLEEIIETKNEENTTAQNDERPATPSTPTDVKSLLKKFTNGFTDTIRRRMSSGGSVDVKHIREYQEKEGKQQEQNPSIDDDSNQNEKHLNSAILREVPDERPATPELPAPEGMSMRKRLSIPFLFKSKVSESRKSSTDDDETSLKKLTPQSVSQSSPVSACEIPKTNGTIDEDENDKNERDLAIESDNTHKSVHTLKLAFEQQQKLTLEESLVKPKPRISVRNAAPSPTPKPDDVQELSLSGNQERSQIDEDDSGPSASLLVIGQRRSGITSIVSDSIFKQFHN
jgi:hypothetical protein